MNLQPTHSLNTQDQTLQALLLNQNKNMKGTTNLGDSREVLLTIKGFQEFITVQEGDEFEFGRYDYPDQHQLNLTPYGALECGLSRQHAKLYLLGGRLYIADMGSTNGTYIRGKMLTPAVPTLVRNGDEILLGCMRIKVQF